MGKKSPIDNFVISSLLIRIRRLCKEVGCYLISEEDPSYNNIFTLRTSALGLAFAEYLTYAES